MLNISKINSVNSFYYPAFKQNQTLTTATNPISTNVAMIGLDATANYNMSIIDKQNEVPNYIQQTLDEHIYSLNSKGLKNNVDYTIENWGTDRCWLEIKNKNGDITDRIEYLDGKLVGAEINTYKDDRLIKCIGRSKYRVETSENFYYRDKYPQERFTDSGINHETTPEKFINYLEKNNIKYNVQYEGEDDNNRSVTLSEYDSNGKVVRNYWWYYGENKFDEKSSWVSVSEMNDNEEEVRRICFENDRTAICDYNYLTKIKDYNNSEYNIKNLTTVGMTYDTTSQEYSDYLKKNNIKYNMKTFPNTSKIEIDEINDKGEVLTSTAWIYEENGNNLERICRFEMSDIGRKRFDFYPDKTSIMTLKYTN